MNKKSVIILWALAIVLGSVVAILSNKKSDSGKPKTTRARGDTLLATFPRDNVAKVVLKSADSTVTLVKKDNAWQLLERENYPVKFTSINSLLRVIETVKVNNAIEAGPTYAKRFGVDIDSDISEKHGIIIETSDASDNKIGIIVVGKDSDSGGKFIRDMADESGIYITNDPFPDASADAKTWLEQEFIKVEKIISVSISPAGKPEETEWKLTRSDENAEFTLDGLQTGEAINTANTAAIKSLLSNASFQDVASSSKRDAHHKADDFRKLRIQTKDGFTYVITLSNKQNEAPPVAIAKSEEMANPPEEAYFMTVTVSADIKKERNKDKDEKPEDAKAKDDAFAASIKVLEEKLATEKAYEGRLYEVSKYVVDAAIKPRSEFITTSQATEAAAPGSTFGANPGAIEATTPPISIEGLAPNQ